MAGEVGWADSPDQVSAAVVLVVVLDQLEVLAMPTSDQSSGPSSMLSGLPKVSTSRVTIRPVAIAPAASTHGEMPQFSCCP